MSRDRLKEDIVIRGTIEVSDLQTPEEQLYAETQRIVNEAWEPYLDVAAQQSGDELINLLELDALDDEDRDGMAQMVEEYVIETLNAWEDDEHQTPTPAELALLLAFLGVKDVQALRGDLSLRENCLKGYAAYAAKQSRIMMEASLPANKSLDAAQVLPRPKPTRH